jgi:hypothetical protein
LLTTNDLSSEKWTVFSILVIQTPMRLPEKELSMVMTPEESAIP